MDWDLEGVRELNASGILRDVCYSDGEIALKQ
jgi:hypothetical protein